MNRSKNSGLKYNMDDKIFAMPSTQTASSSTRECINFFFSFAPQGKYCLAKAMLLFIIIIIIISILSKGGVI